MSSFQPRALSFLSVTNLGASDGRVLSDLEALGPEKRRGSCKVTVSCMARYYDHEDTE